MKKLMAYGIVLLIVIVSLVAMVSMESKTQEVQLRVIYGGDWQGAYGDTSGVMSWSGSGALTISMERPSGTNIWVVTVNAQKMDDSGNQLTVQILDANGKILKEASTTAPYGVAQTTWIED
mgnify:CR=1 FL=1